MAASGGAWYCPERERSRRRSPRAVEIAASQKLAEAAALPCLLRYGADASLQGRGGAAAIQHLMKALRYVVSGASTAHQAGKHSTRTTLEGLPEVVGRPSTGAPYDAVAASSSRQWRGTRLRVFGTCK